MKYLLFFSLATLGSTFLGAMDAPPTDSIQDLILEVINDDIKKPKENPPLLEICEQNEIDDYYAFIFYFLLFEQTTKPDLKKYYQDRLLDLCDYNKPRIDYPEVLCDELKKTFYEQGNFKVILEKISVKVLIFMKQNLPLEQLDKCKRLDTSV